MAKRGEGAGASGTKNASSDDLSPEALAEQARSTASAALGRAREEGTRLAQQARERAEAFADQQKEAAANQVGGVADALRRTAEGLNESNTPFAGYAQDAAEGLDRLAGTLRSKDLSSLIGDLEDLARRQPALFVGATMLGGFLVARFLKSSAERSYAAAQPAGGYGAPARRGRGTRRSTAASGGSDGEGEGMTNAGSASYPSSRTTANTLAGAAGRAERSGGPSTGAE